MKVGVVGAGVTGLALTRYLRERDVDVATFEATSEPGGVVESRRVDGRVLEYGPQRFRLTDELEALVDGLGLDDELVVADESPLYVYADGRLRRVPRSLSAFLRTDLLSWRGKARLLAEPLTAAGRPDESAATLFTRKFGAETYRNLVEPLFGGTFGSDPARMPAEHSLSGVLALEAREGSLLRAAVKRLRSGETPPPVSFRDGLATLPNALADAHRECLEFDAPVDALREADGGYELVVGDRREAVDAVVVTAPAPDAAALLEPVVPEAAALRELTYNPLALVHLRADVERDGFGYQVRRDEPLRTLGVSWNASLFDREGVFTCFLGGMTDPGLVDSPPAEIGAIARSEFETVMDASASVLDVTRYPRAFPAYDETWDRLDAFSLPDGLHLATNYTGRMGIPSRVREAERLAATLA